MINHRQKGFTLVELAMVLFIVGLLLGGLLVPLSNRIEGEERRRTTAMLSEIRDSLIAYAMVNGHLPCPDCTDTAGNCSIINAVSEDLINDGHEDLTDGTASVTRSSPVAQCATAQGNLPWVTLGVPQLDAWGNRFSYAVTGTFADNIDGTTGSGGCTVTPGVSFQICSAGNIIVNDSEGNAVAQNLPALVISYGKNATELNNPSSAFEIENQNGTNVFIDTTYSTNPDVQFDDILTWVPANTLIYRMVQAERLP